MAGRPGRNRAWNKVSLEDHLQRGTYRADRHGPQAGWPKSEPLPPPWTPSPEDLEGLQVAGRTFIRRIVDAFVVDAAQGVLLLQAAQLLDELVGWRATAATDPQAARLALQYTKTFAAILAQVGLR